MAELDRDRLATLLANTRDIVSILDADGRFQYVSPASGRVIGYAPEDLVGEDAFERVHRDDRAAARTEFRTAIETGERGEAQLRYRTAGGEWVWLECITAGEYDDDLGGYIVTARDVSERKHVERQRRRTRERLEELTDTVFDVLWMFSGDWEEVLFVNDAYEEVFGRPVENLQSDPLDFLEGVHPDDRERIRAAIEQISAGETVDVEYRVNPDEDYRRWVWVRGTPVVEDGEVVRAVGFARDVTERVEHRRQLRVMDRILRHNLHNDMNVVLGYAEHARSKADEAVAQDLDRAIERGRRLLRTVDKQREIVELLDPTPSREIVDLPDVVRRTVESLAEQHPDTAVDLDLPESTPVEANPEIGHAVEELVDNAIEHASEASVTVREDGDEVVLEVADRGPGIPEQEIRVLTGEQDVEPMYHGSGLGLWLVAWIVRRSGGDLEFDPNEPSGSRVRIRLDKPDD